MDYKLPLFVDYSNKVIVITGAGGVLCSEMAKAFALCHAKVALLDLHYSAAEAKAEEKSKPTSANEELAKEKEEMKKEKE